MSDFPRTTVGGVSLSRMVIGSNWLLGFSHTSLAKDTLIKEHHTRQTMAEILKVFLAAGVDTLMGVRPESPQLQEAIEDAQQATGRKLITITTPILNIADTPEARDENERLLAGRARLGATFCLPHQATTDALVNRRTRKIEGMAEICAAIRRHGMIPGLSTHMPESVVYADESGLDVETYIQIYNAAGFLMQIEADWVHRMIWRRKKPVICIKPLAAGRLLPLVGLSFVWSTIRPQDLMCVGVMTPDEAREIIELSLALLERREVRLELQKTRSKESVQEREQQAACPGM